MARTPKTRSENDLGPLGPRCGGLFFSMKTGIHGLGHGQLVQIQSEETGDGGSGRLGIGDHIGVLQGQDRMLVDPQQAAGSVDVVDLGLLFAAWGPCD